MNFLLAIDKAKNKVTLVACGIASGIILVMIFPTTADVILRYVFNAPLPGMFQLTEFMMIGAVYLAIAYVQSVKGHVIIEAATTWLPKRGQLVLDVFGLLLGLVIFSIMAWQVGVVAWEAWVTQDYTMGIIHFPFWPAKGLLTIGVGLLCLTLIVDLVIGFAKLLGILPDGHEQKEGQA